MKKLLSALFALALCSSMALATVPYPPNCSVDADALSGVVLCPDVPSVIPQSIVNMTIRNQANNPIANAAVNIQFAAGPMCFCTSMNYNTTTDASGKASLTLRGGGCMRGVTDAAVIRANGVVVRTYSNAKSPDWDGAAGNCTVNLADAVRFVGPPTDLCFDFASDGSKDLGDVVVFTAGFTPGHSCAH